MIPILLSKTTGSDHKTNRQEVVTRVVSIGLHYSWKNLYELQREVSEPNMHLYTHA